jgi:hypothetical protein
LIKDEIFGRVKSWDLIIDDSTGIGDSLTIGLQEGIKDIIQDLKKDELSLKMEEQIKNYLN